MKKLLLILLVVTLASFLFVGCLPTTPAEGEGEGETAAAVCPTVSVTSQVVVEGKTYIKSGAQTITVTFTVPTEPVSVYIGAALKIEDPSSDKVEVVMYANTDKTVYTGTFKFLDEDKGEKSNDCVEAYIYVDTCDACASCKYPYIVDKEPPYLLLELNSDPCTCEGVFLDFMVETDSQDCAEDTHCCNDRCTALVSGSLAVYDEDPFNDCCEISCVAPLWNCSFEGCPDDVTLPLCTTSCLDPQAIHNGETYVTNPNAPSVYYLVVKLMDVVGNENTYYAQFILTLNEASGYSDVFCQRFYEDGDNDCACTTWTNGPETDPNDADDWVGYCYYQNYCGQGIDRTNWISLIGD